MEGLPCLVSQCAKLHVAGGTWAVFTHVYLESRTWPVAIFTMDQRTEQQVCIRFCANLGKSATETLTMIQQASKDQSLSRVQVFQWHAQFKTSCTSVDDDEHTGRPTSCTNSRARPSGSTSYHSQHCWGGGNWLWDRPTDSERRIGHAPCRNQICVQDPGSWPEVAAHRRLYWTSSARLWWWNLLVQGHHWWWEQSLQLWPWDKATILPVEKPHIAKVKKGQTGEKQCQEHDYHFLWRQGDYVQRMSQQAKLWIQGSTANFWGDCVKTCKDIAPKFGENKPGCFIMTTSRLTLPSSPSSFWPKQNGCHPLHTVLPWFGTLWLLPISKYGIEAERTPV